MKKLYQNNRWFRSAVWLGSIVLFTLISMLMEYLWVGSFDKMVYSLALANMTVSIILFITLFEIFKQLLSLPWQPLAVAKVMLDEALRMRAPMAFMVTLLVMVSVLPFLGDSEFLRYRVQSFLNLSLTGSYFLITVITICVAAGTMNQELEKKMFHTTLVKPLGRLSFMLGKWIGLVCMNAALLLVAMVAIYIATYAYVLPGNSIGLEDRMTVLKEVIIARGEREVAAPSSKFFGRSDAELALNELKEKSPAGYESMKQVYQLQDDEDMLRLMRQWEDESGRGELQARVSLERARVEEPQLVIDRGEHTVLQHYRIKAEAANLSVAPMTQRVIVFTDLDHLERSPDKHVQIRYKVTYTKDIPATVKYQTLIPLRFLVTNIPGTTYDSRVINSKYDEYQTLKIPTNLINEKGELHLTIENLELQEQIQFPVEDGMILYYPDGYFIGNMARAFVIFLVQLSFFSALAMTLASLISFPLAVLIAMMFPLVSLASGFILQEIDYMKGSVKQYTEFEEFYRAIIIYMNTYLVRPLQFFQEYSPIGYLTNGIKISYGQTAKAMLMIGLFWTGLTMTLGWILFRMRELARVQV